jgi:hypothetical protein
MSEGGPTLILSFFWAGEGASAAGGVGAGMGRGRAPGGGVGMSCLKSAAGGRKTKSFFSSVFGSTSSNFRGDDGWAISIIRRVRWRIAETRNP